MSTYSNGRRGPNVSQFLRELNENPASPEHPLALDDRERDLSMFTNTEFFDFETGRQTDFTPQPGKPESDGQDTSMSEDLGSAASVMGDFPSLDFIAGDFNFPDFGGTYASPTISAYQDSLGSLQPIQPGPPQSVYPALAQQPHHNGYPPPPPPPGARIGGDKRNSLKQQSDVPMVSPTRPLSLEEQSRLAAEEDKRRRNTAASARFRVKKKQREQALEKSAKEMSEKVTALEGRIQQLETENKWLKGIVMEKNAGNPEFLSKLLEEYNAKGGAAASKKDDIEEEVIVKAPTSPEARDAGDSSG